MLFVLFVQIYGVELCVIGVKRLMRKLHYVSKAMSNYSDIVFNAKVQKERAVKSASGQTTVGIDPQVKRIDSSAFSY
ncbi:hypothetical protein AT1G31835 [Arabidopsis thaliana]|uniref:At1g31835 n=1 Tax=Arabidopsis thaliana TaxID=3702 RepID=Q8LCK8_ARATH|nr:uncharacterized protein AT1G31835 [Arabidopsis thaliana]AAM67319.1 unknown [Arabidopsis thaliana]ABG25109.1 At1g31835 [Arabidopsis thaliana]AEE31402.1 hypothetical protein AT1G31835 [Arabidopsis thaliana]|eukprot:NP_973948.1 hypothetical protein AT1G31835 [Arabidopsis thaliana]